MSEGLIKGMEMPNRCLDCPLMVSRDNDECIVQSEVANEIAKTWEDLRANCPLMEVKTPHGRLIDASTRVTTGTQRGFGLRVVTVDTLIDEHAVRNVPTIIEGSNE